MADKDIPRDVSSPPDDQSKIAGHDEDRRRWAEQEAADEAQEEYYRSLAIEKMVDWFQYHFEDPQYETPQPEGEFLYVWGGPFNASEVLFDQFFGEHDEDLIQAAVDEVEENGIYEWAPTSIGDFYEHPEPDEDTKITPPSVTRESLIASAFALKNQLGELHTKPQKIGHNQPPEEIGSPPYADEDKDEIAQLIEITEEEAFSDDPDINRIRNVTSKLGEFALQALKYAGSKFDLAIDESIKKGAPITIAYLAFGGNLQIFIESVKNFFGL